MNFSTTTTAALTCSQQAAVCFSSKDHGTDAAVELAPTMRAMGRSGSHTNAGGQLAVCITGEVTHTLKAEGFDASEDGTGRGQPIVGVEYAYYSHDYAHDRVTSIRGINPALTSETHASGNLNIFTGWAVRRLMPIECERLQAFPDNYTLIPVKKAKKRSAMYDYAEIDGQLWQLAADGPRYKALGNSMCVHNMRWIGARIQQHLTLPFGDLL